jgi:putative transposase
LLEQPIPLNGKPGMAESDVSKLVRVKELEAENSQLKRLLADALLDNAALKDIASRKW